MPPRVNPHPGQPGLFIAEWVRRSRHTSKYSKDCAKPGEVIKLKYSFIFNGLTYVRALWQMGKLTGKGKLCRSNVKVPALEWKSHAFWVYCGFSHLKNRKWFVSDKG
jgi:hypothetical protein|tara:strand:+ start:198 stop:518 length:321 start_codon:yes stop_codon:yes gene_type:complete